MGLVTAKDVMVRLGITCADCGREALHDLGHHHEEPEQVVLKTVDAQQEFGARLEHWDKWCSWKQPEEVLQ